MAIDLMRVALLGTGLMGAPMARNLCRAGLDVAAWNRSPDKARPLAELGATVAASPADAAYGADVAIVMTSTADVADQVLFGPSGAAAALRAGSVVAVMSSIPVESARAQAARLAEMGIDYVDAPVSGGERGATAGELAIMAGGDAAVIERLAPAFSALGRATRVGPVGAGQLAKLANQMIVGTTIGAVAEALLLVERGGGDVDATLAALRGGFADSTVLRQHGARMAHGDFTPGAHATTQLKDLRTATALAGRLGVELPLALRCEELFSRMCGGSLAEADHSALYLLLAGREEEWPTRHLPSPTI